MLDAVHLDTDPRGKEADEDSERHPVDAHAETLILPLDGISGRTGLGARRRSRDMTVEHKKRERQK